MDCVSSSTMAFLFNGSVTETFSPSRGIQGDPLYRYLFILRMEYLSITISRACEVRDWQPLQIARGPPTLFHLFFGDDLVLFGKATIANCNSIRQILDTFCESRAKNSTSKSPKLFSRIMFLTLFKRTLQEFYTCPRPKLLGSI